MTFAPVNSLSPFIPTFQEFPVKNIPEMKRILTKAYSTLATSINLRESGSFETVEQLNGQRFYDLGGNNQRKKFVYRKCFETGAIAAGATLNLAHGINPVDFVNIYGTVATDAPDWRPLPYVDTLALSSQISILVTAVNIVIVNGVAPPNAVQILSGKVILEYLKN